MASHELNKLETKFWQGLTNEEEEIYLRSKLQEVEDTNIRDYLTHSERESEFNPLGNEFDQMILSKIKNSKFKSIRTGWYGIAASLVLILGMAWSLNFYLPIQHQNQIVVEDTFEDPQQAYDEVKRVLMLLSSNMNEGMDRTEILGEFHRTKMSLENKRK